MQDRTDTPRITDAPVTWGILGAGKIARQFTTELVKLPAASVVGVASRQPETSARFAREFAAHDAPRAFESFEALCADPGIDVVYIATPTATHADMARLALESGKAVLCEKPFCRNAEEAEAVFALARSRGLFAMEAMWLRFNPLIRKAKALLDEGAIGDLRTMTVELGYAKGAEASGTAAEGRGARLAFGCYGASLALYLFGAPTASSLRVIRSGTGAEDSMALMLEYPELTATIQTSEWATLSNDVRLMGRRGSIVITAPFIDTTALEVTRLDQLGQRSLTDKLLARLGKERNPFADPGLRGSGFRGEADEVMQCLRAGALESALMPPSETIAVHRILQTSD